MIQLYGMTESHKCHPNERIAILCNHPRYHVLETSGVTMEKAQVVKEVGGSAISQIVTVGDTQRGEI